MPTVAAHQRNDMNELTRREILQSAAVGALLVASDSGAQANPEAPPNAALAKQLEAKPLPFDPKSLRGLSEKLVTSHWENNYGGAVKALNATRAKLASYLSSNDPPYLYNEFKREHLIRTGSVVLHELYFQNLGGDGKASADVRTKLSNAFGSFDAWESEFRKIGQGLGGGSGWVVLGYNEHLKVLENYWLADHAHHPAYTRPVLVMDMYEHAYHIDYGAAAAKYIDAFFANIQWDTVASRLSRSAA
jgi:Fe-Mn family superoxide dismutase